MVKKRSASSVHAARRAKSVKTISDAAIDFSDIPEFSEKELERARPVGRPRLKHPKKLLAIRLAPKLIDDLRKLAAKKHRPYQTLLHELLEEAVKRAA